MRIQRRVYRVCEWNGDRAQRPVATVFSARGAVAILESPEPGKFSLKSPDIGLSATGFTVVTTGDRLGCQSPDQLS
jgi:hypothetical protein